MNKINKNLLITEISVHVLYLFVRAGN